MDAATPTESDCDNQPELALAYIKAALEVWRPDSDDASAANEHKAWANLLDVADQLALLTGQPRPDG